MDTAPLPPNPCCPCCRAAAERGELDHELSPTACPYPPCNWHQPDAADWAAHLAALEALGVTR